MKREILVCDRCGASAETTKEKEALGLGHISLGFHADYFSSLGRRVFADHKEWDRDWCRKCRTELNILEEKIRLPDQPQPPSLEEMIRQIVREEQEAR